MSLFLAPLGAVLLSTQAAVAQDIEYREPEVEETENKLSVNGGFESEWHEYHNLDFRPLDESSDQAILDSDDRGGFPFTGAWLDMSYQVEPGISFVMGASHRGLWGDDQLGNVNVFISEGSGVHDIVAEMEASGAEVPRDAFGHGMLDKINPGAYFATRLAQLGGAEKTLVQ